MHACSRKSHSVVQVNDREKYLEWKRSEYNWADKQKQIEFENIKRKNAEERAKWK